MTRWWHWALLIAVASGLHAAPTLTPEDIGTSARVPSVGRAVTYTVRLNAPAEAPLAGNYGVALSLAGRTISTQTVALKLAAGRHRDVPLTWTPAQDGWQRLTFTVTPTGEAKPSAQLEQLVPVTNRPLYFLWFGAPRRFQWCNVPTTVRPAERSWWLWHGAIPCGWKGGVCYKDWSVEQFTKSYDDTPWIAIDEVGTNDELGQKILGAVRNHKRAHPEGCRALWYMGVHDHWREVRDCVDLFVPEIYLNYGGNHLGKIDYYVQRTREVGCMDRMIPGLGINVIEDKDRKPTVSPTKEDVLRQIIRLKTVAPELNGVGFFTSDSCAPGVAEYADELCKTYYIDPVLTLVEGSLQARVKGTKLELTARLRNDGGMTARGVRVRFDNGWVAGHNTWLPETVRVTSLAAQSETTVTAALPLLTWPERYGLDIEPREGQTTLNRTLWTMAAQGLKEPWVVFRPPTRLEADALPLPLFADVRAGVPVFSATQLDSKETTSPAAILPGMPNEDGGVVTWVPKSPSDGLPTTFALNANRSAGMDMKPERTGDILKVVGTGYAATLNLAQDQITSLRQNPPGADLIGSPWQFSSTGYSGTQPATVDELPAGLLVTIPFANPQAEGFSRYFCYRDAPVIRIERYFAPKAEMTVTGSSEGCGMPQRGGTFAAQGGVGGVVNRGQLHNATDYRDLLFGYLGAGPGPENARLAGWFDCTFDGGGLGVAIERRWETAKSDVGYDVTRYYDGGDWLAVLNLWGKGMSVKTPQTMILYLIPHGAGAFDDPKVTPPAQALWENVHHRAQVVVQ